MPARPAQKRLNALGSGTPMGAAAIVRLSKPKVPRRFEDWKDMSVMGDFDVTPK